MAKLNFKQLGEGEPMIILHGLYGSSDNWVSIARELMTDFHVYLPDLRNHGASPHLPEHNYLVMADDLLEFMNEHQIYSSIIIGHSMGGKVAISFTAIHPERVKRLIVVDISPRTYSLDMGDQQALEHQTILETLSSINLKGIKKREEVDQLIIHRIPQPRIRQFILKNLVRAKENYFRWKLNIGVLMNSIPQVLAGLEGDKDDLNEFRNPVLFIKGENSPYISDIDKTLINELFPQNQLITIANASHWVHAEQPDELIRVIKRFCM